jgi:hypothetical protein
MQASLHAHTREWSGNPAVLGSFALRPVALRPRLSNGFALNRCGQEHGPLRAICLVVWHFSPLTALRQVSEGPSESWGRISGTLDAAAVFPR